ncbi:hypothetical protein AKJ18_10540 [Vibrio xuii]|nr:hypothetical protein AKJ18_10540 [Vibrio xuii]
METILFEQHYKKTIYLNDRPYDVLDVGEGQCLVVVQNNNELTQTRGANSTRQCRTIYVDISRLWLIHSGQMSSLEEYLESDLHLLFDVFWLEKIDFKSELKGIDLDKVQRMVDHRNRAYPADDVY